MTKVFTYRAKAPGVMDDVLRKTGEVFTSSMAFADKKGSKLPPLPTWIEVVDTAKEDVGENPGEPSAEDRVAILTKAMKAMKAEDPEQKSEKMWIGSGAPEIAELERRTRLKGITAKERNKVWASQKFPPSGTV